MRVPLRIKKNPFIFELLPTILHRAARSRVLGQAECRPAQGRSLTGLFPIAVEKGSFVAEERRIDMAR